MLNKGDMVLVEWDDATADPEWHSADSVEWPAMRMVTMGFYWQQDHRAIMLFDSLCEDWQEDDGTVGGMSTIPVGMIRRITMLTPSEDAYTLGGPRPDPCPGGTVG